MSTDQKGGNPQGYNQPVNYVYSTQSSAVVTQPYQDNVTLVRPDDPPPDYLTISLISCLFCWPMAICAVVSSCNSKSSAETGDYATAETEGRTAKKIAIPAIVIGTIISTMIVVWLFIRTSSGYRTK